MDRTVQVDGHNIGILASPFGRETIRYDGLVMSRKSSMMGGTHVFAVNEAEVAAAYEVRLRLSWTGMSCRISVKKNGTEVLSEKVSTPKTGAVNWCLCATISVLAFHFFFRVGASLPIRVSLPVEARRLTNEEIIALRNTARRNSVIVLATHGQESSKGSGFVIRRIGDKAIVATNAHVVLENGSTAKRIAVKPPGAQSYMKAGLLYAEEDPRLGQDLALLVVRDSTSQLGQQVRLAKEVKEGEFVLSVGSPLNEEFTIDDGVIRDIGVSSKWGSTIYHDALIEHGSSGGGLFNAKGELVGINTYILSDGRTGVALSNSVFLDKLKVYSLQVNANEGWQESGIQVNPEDERIVVVAQGRWSISLLLPNVDASGYNDKAYDQYSLFPAMTHGSLLISLDGGKNAVAIDRWWKGADPGDSKCRSQSLEQRNAAVSFRINDVATSNNGGQIDVTVVIW